MRRLSGQKLRSSRLWSTMVCIYPFLHHVFITYFPPRFTDQIFLILYRELYYRHVYSRLQPDIDDRFHSYENSCELFNYLLSQWKSRSFCHPKTRLTFCRLRRPRPSGVTRAVALGHHRRIHLSIPVLLRVAVEGEVEE